MYNLITLYIVTTFLRPKSRFLSMCLLFSTVLRFGAIAFLAVLPEFALVPLLPANG